MSVDKRVRDALISITPVIPALNGVFFSDADEYYVFHETTMGADYADDAPGAERHLVSVHLFAPLGEDITARKTATKNAIFNAGFTWPQVEDDSDGNGRHLVFSFEDAEGVVL